VSVLADHRVDPGDDGPPPAVSRAPATAAVDVPQGDGPVEHAGTSYADPGYAETDYADGEYAETDYADGEYADGEYADEAYPDAGYAVPAADPSPPRPDRLPPDQLRADFGAHFEAHYQRLVAQLYAITLNPAEAHDVVREAYSRAWRKWAEIGASAEARQAATTGRRRRAAHPRHAPRAGPAARRRTACRRAGRHGRRARRRGRRAGAGAPGDDRSPAVPRSPRGR
jgi:hypothetical protein